MAARNFLGQAFFSIFGVWGHFCGILLVCSPYGKGQWAGQRAHPNFGFLSSLPPPLFWVCLSVVCPGRRRDPPPQSVQEKPSGNGASDPNASWYGRQH